MSYNILKQFHMLPSSHVQLVPTLDHVWFDCVLLHALRHVFRVTANRSPCPSMADRDRFRKPVPEIHVVSPQSVFRKHIPGVLTLSFSYCDSQNKQCYQQYHSSRLPGACWGMYMHTLADSQRDFLTEIFRCTTYKKTNIVQYSVRPISSERSLYINMPSNININTTSLCICETKDCFRYI